MAKLKKLDKSAHFESARGSVSQNRDYCAEDGDFHEFGEIPAEQTARATTNTRLIYAEAIEKAKKGDFTDIDPVILAHCYGNLKRIRTDEQLKSFVSCLENNSKVGLWVKGKPELGKSFFARFFCETRNLRYYFNPIKTR